MNIEEEKFALHGHVQIRIVRWRCSWNWQQRGTRGDHLAVERASEPPGTIDLITEVL